MKLNLSKIFIVPSELNDVGDMYFDISCFGKSVKPYLVNKNQIEKILETIKFQICVSLEFLDAYGVEDKFWTRENKQKLRIIFSSNSLIKDIERIQFLLEKKFCVDIFVENPDALKKLISLQGLAATSSSLRFFIVESEVFLKLDESVLNFLPPQLRSQVYFMYLPVSNEHTFGLIPKDVLSVLKRRESECLDNNLSLKVISIVNEETIKINSSKKVFYLNPNLENYLNLYLHSAENETSIFLITILKFFFAIQLYSDKFYKYFMSFILFILWKLKHFYWDIEQILENGTSKLFFIIRKTYWHLFPGVGHAYVGSVKMLWKIRSTHSLLKISLMRGRGIGYGLLVNIFWITVRPVLKLIWFLYSKVRELMSIFFNSCIWTYWKFFSLLKNFSGQVRSILVVAYWKCKKNADLFSNNLTSFYWRTKPNMDQFLLRCENIFWFIKKIKDQFLIFVENLIWKFLKSKIGFPILKTYWFLHFQINKRVFHFFKKKSKSED